MLKLWITIIIYFDDSTTMPTHTFPIYGDKIAIYETRNPEQYFHRDIKLVMNNLICTVMRHEAYLVNIAAAPSKKSHSLKSLL